MEAKKSKGRQKLILKKIENERELYISFSKRKSGINKKASELTARCGAKVDVLLVSPTGKSYCYGNPLLASMEMSSSGKQNPHQEKDINVQLADELKRKEIMELNEKSDALADELYAEKAIEEELEKVLKTKKMKKSCYWWYNNLEEASNKKIKEFEEHFVDLRKSLINELSTESEEKVSDDQTNGVSLDTNNSCGGIKSSAESIVPDFCFGPRNEDQTAPLHQTNGTNLYPTHASSCDNSEVALGASNKASEIGTSESFPSDFTFNFTDEEGGDDFYDLLFPPENQGNETS